MRVPTTGASLLVRALTLAGVKQIFTLSGNQIMPVFDACLDESIELIHVRHEAAAVHMADAWGRLTGEPGIALVTAGPGHANALSALFVALAAESPLVLLSGHAPRSQLGLGAFQEMSQAEMAGHVAKASWTATQASALGHELSRALRLAKTGRPGPVHLSLPVDLLEATVDGSAELLPQPDDFQPSVSLLDVQTAEEVTSALAAAKTPLVLTGPSMTRPPGCKLSSQFAAVTQVPVIGMESPRGINDPSLGAFAEILAEADLVVLVGKQLNFTLCFGSSPIVRSDCRFIQLDAETRILEQTARVIDDPARLVVSDLADPIPAMERLIQIAEQSGWPKTDWFDEVQSATAYRPSDWATLRSSQDGCLHAVELCRAVQEFLDDGETSVLISDGGEFGQWAQACLWAPFRLINGLSGSIGSSIPFALAARTAMEAIGADADSRVVTMLGDGTFGFQPLEFDTAVRHDLPFIAVVGNDACWNAERQIQLNKYGPERVFGCDLLPTRYDKVVKSLGGHGEFITQASELKPALERAFESNRPACVNVALEANAAPIIRRSP